MKTITFLFIFLLLVGTSCSVENEPVVLEETTNTRNPTLPGGGIGSETTGDEEAILYQDDLIAGQNIDVGTVTVTVNIDGTLTVTYETEGDWQIDETHLFIGQLGDLPINGGGNPQIGQFPYATTESGGTTMVVITSTLAEGECVYIAAHAVVTNTVTGQNETAWGNGVPINNGGGNGNGNGGGNGNGNGNGGGNGGNGGGSWAMMFEVCN